MGIYRRPRHNHRANFYSASGGYDSGGRWRSEAWHMDGGSNDEGWHRRYCGSCNKETEHARGGGCVECDNRIIAARARKNRNNPAKFDRQYVFSLYEKKAGNLPGFLKSLKEQNEFRCLSDKQVLIGKKILSKHIESETLETFWVAAHKKRR